jgi:hypothetical protein
MIVAYKARLPAARIDPGADWPILQPENSAVREKRI